MRKSPWAELMANVRKSRPGANPKKVLRTKVDITEDDLRAQFKKQKGRCYWLGIKLTPKDIFKSYYPLAMSVDRLDNDMGYTPNNIVITCRFANLGRGRCTVKEFRKIIKKIKGMVKYE